MAFNQELDDFASGFSKGYDMVQSKEEKENERLRNEYLAGSVEAQQAEAGRRPTRWAQEDAAFKLQQQTGQVGLESAQERLITEKRANEPSRVAVDDAIQKAKLEAAQLEQKVNQLTYELASDPDNIALQKRTKEAVADAADLDVQIKQLTLRQEELKTKDAESFDKMFAPLRKAIEQQANPGTQPLNEAVPAGPVTFEPPAAPEVDIPLDDREGDTSADKAPGPSAVPAGTDQPLASAVPAGTDQPLAYTAEAPPRERFGQFPVEMEGSDMTDAQKAIENLLNGNLTSSKDKKNAVIDASKEATKVGLEYMAEQNGLNQDHAVDTPEVEQQQESFLTGAKGADPEAGQMVMDMVNQAAGGGLTLDEQATYALGLGYLWHLAKGDPEAAAKYAGSMVGFNQRMASQYAVFGQAADANGDVSAADEAIMRAYAHVTNGEKLHVTPTEDGRFMATITDMKTGKVRHEQIMSPEERGAMVMGVGADSYVKLISQAAGIPDKTISDEAAILLGLTKGIKDPEMAIKLFGNLTTQEFNSLTMSEKAANQGAAAAGEAAAKRQEARQVKPTDMDDIDTGITTAMAELTDKNPDAFGKAGETFANQEELMAAGDVADYSDQVRFVATDLMTNPENYGKLGAKEAVRIARTLAEKRPDNIEVDRAGQGDPIIRIYVKGHPAGLAMDRQHYNDIGLVRNYKDAIQNKDTKQPAPAPVPAPPEVVGSPGSAALEAAGGAVDAGPGVSAAPARHPRVGGTVTPLLPGGPSRLEGPSRANMPRPPPESARPRSRSDFPPRLQQEIQQLFPANPIPPPLSRAVPLGGGGGSGRKLPTFR